MRVVEELNCALHELMRADASLHIMGEDILDPYGGAFKVTKGLSTAFPQRVLTTPISEAAIVGFATGMAMRGKPVIAEIMFGDFLALTMDQLLNHASKAAWMFNDALIVPMIVRTPMGGGRGYGPTHSQSIEKHFCGMPGLTVLAVNQYMSPAMLLKRAYELRSPVLFIENKVMYSTLVEPGKLPTHSKPDLVMVTYGGVAKACVGAAARLAKEEEILADVICIEQLSPFDRAPLQVALGKCGRILTVEEGSEGWGFGAECARVLLEAGARDVIMRSVAAAPHPIPNSRDWEMQALPGEQRILEAALALVAA